LEYIPNRKNDGTALRDSLYHPYFAGHGYAAMRVDMRGSGDSEGVMLDEYLQQELDDAVSVMAWLAEQSWCDGSVGMMGKSWGGFNSLQVAALQPPELKAIITVCSSDDRYGRCTLQRRMRLEYRYARLVYDNACLERTATGPYSAWRELA